MRRTANVVFCSGVLLALATSNAFGQAAVPPPDRHLSSAVQGVSGCKFLPLKFDSSDDEVKEFYTNAKGVLAMEQVKFIASKNQKAVSVDWLTGFVSPFRLAAGTTLSDTSNPPGDNPPKTTAQNTADDTMTKFTQGGDLYFTAT